MRANTGIRKTALFAFCQIAFICTTLFLIASTFTACSGYGDDYANNLLSNDFFSSSSDRYKSSSSVKTFFSSSSSVKYSSSSKKRNFFDESSSSISDSDNIVPIVNTFEGLDSCQDGKRLALRNDSTIYRCFYGTWYKEIKKLPECNNKTEKKTFFKSLPYICVSGEWREITEMDVELGFCTEKLQGTTKTFGKKEYTCDSLSWRKTTLIDINGECSSANIGKKITYDNTDYVCRDNLWQSLNSIELDSGLCTPSRSGEIIKIKASSYFKYYICKNYEWTYTESPADIYGKCTSAKEDSAYTVYTTSFACRNGEWRSLTSNETRYGLCTTARQDSVVTINKTNHIICDKHEWRTATAEDYYGKCTAALQDTLYSDNSKTYACNNLKWTELPEPPVSSLSYCTKVNENTKYKTTSPKAYYICTNYAWQKIDSLSYVYGLCIKDSLGVRKHPNKDSLGYECKETSSGYGWAKLTINDYGITCNADIQDSVFKGYLCDNSQWRALTALEKSLGICSVKNIGKAIKSGSKYYECKSSGWTTISEEDYAVSVTPCNEENDSTAIKTKTAIYFCAEGKWFVPPPSTGSRCYYGENEGQIVTSGNGYLLVCNHSGWNIVDDLVYTTGMCTQKRNGMIVPHDKYFAKCLNGYWTSSSPEEYLASRSCSEKVSMSGLEYTCNNGYWAPTYGTVKDSRDGQTYRTLKVGELTWMVDNLNYRTANSWCYSDPNKCSDYGRFYTWENVKDACPDGWHVPDAYEFKTLTSVKPQIEIKDMDYWQSSPNDQDVYRGFELRGAGIRTVDGKIDYERRVAGFWLADSMDRTTAFAEIYGVPNAQNFTESIQYYPYDPNDSKSPIAYGVSMDMGLNIRCVKKN